MMAKLPEDFMEQYGQNHSKCYVFGVDIEELSHSELLAAFRSVIEERDQAYQNHQRTIAMMKIFNERSRH